MSGFVAVHRSLWGHPLFEDGVMTEREAWIWMLSRAAWKDTRHRVGTATLCVPRGAFMTTLRELQRVFKWKSDTRVRTFLLTLETEGMIERKAVGKGNAQKTQINICNYEQYQGGERTRNAEITHGERTNNAVKEQGNKETRKQPVTALPCPNDVPADLWADFMAVRKAHKAPVTANALDGLRREAEKAGWTLKDAVHLCVTNGWRSFQAHYVKDRVAATALRAGGVGI